MQSITMISRLAILLILSLFPRTLPAQTASIDGIWLSEGYGLVFEIQGDRLSQWQVTSISCIPAMAFQRLNKSDNTFASADGRSKLQIRPGGSADLLRLHFEYSAAEVILHRTAARPAQCSKATENTSEMNFEIFWRTFAEQYPFFGLHGVDWNASYQNYRRR